MRQVCIEIFYWIDRWADDQAVYFPKAKACGFDGVEISLISGPDMPVADIRSALQANALQVYCSLGLPLEMDITSPDRTRRRAGIEYLKRCLETSARMGSPVLGGVPYAPWLHFPAAGDLQPYRDRSATALREVAATAADLGLDLCLEILNRFETYLFNTVSDGLAFLEAIGHPAVKLQLDTFHMNMEEDNLPDAIRLAGAALGHFHCAANNRKLPGRGHIDWPAIKLALDEVQYTGPLVIETFPNPQAETGRTVNTWRSLVQDADREARQAAEFVRNTLA